MLSWGKGAHYLFPSFFPWHSLSTTTSSMWPHCSIKSSMFCASHWEYQKTYCFAQRERSRGFEAEQECAIAQLLTIDQPPCCVLGYMPPGYFITLWGIEDSDCSSLAVQHVQVDHLAQVLLSHTDLLPCHIASSASSRGPALQLLRFSYAPHL